LVDEEKAMSDCKFKQTWNMEYAEKIKASRLRRGIIKVEAQKATPEPIEGIDFVVSRTGNGDVQIIEYLTAADEPSGRVYRSPRLQKSAAARLVVNVSSSLTGDPRQYREKATTAHDIVLNQPRLG